jgi:hypothetical protein
VTLEQAKERIIAKLEEAIIDLYVIARKAKGIEKIVYFFVI